MFLYDFTSIAYNIRKLSPDGTAILKNDGDIAKQPHNNHPYQQQEKEYDQDQQSAGQYPLSNVKLMVDFMDDGSWRNDHQRRQYKRKY